MLLRQLLKDEDVSYYRNQNSNYEIDFRFSVNQLQRFYELGLKGEMVTDILDLNDVRGKHSLSTLYLGCIINSKLNLQLDITVGSHFFDFKYFWSLLCLFHDLGYSIENNSSIILKIRNENVKNCKNRNYFLRNETTYHNLKYSYKYNRFFKTSINPFLYSLQDNRSFSRRDIRIDLSSFDVGACNIKFNSLGVEIDKSQYFDRTIESYAKYRIDEFGVLDHGIYGGYIFYDRFCKNYIKKFKETIHNDVLDFTLDNLYFKIEQIPLMAYIADCIVSHNIFTPNESKRDLYINYGLDELCKNVKINFLSNPLLFLFDLVDSIEPIKFFLGNDVNFDDIVNGIDLIFLNKSITISFIDDSSITNSLQEKYFESICSLKNWMDINVERHDDLINISFTY